MFSGLDEIEWAELIHAYGDASDVPDDIRALVSSDEKTAKDALRRLFSTIYHQGTRYTATAPAVPFLAEASLALKPDRAAAVLGLLSAIAEPVADRIYDDQITVEAFRTYVHDEELSLSEDDFAECISYGCPPSVEIEVYDAVVAQIPRLICELDVSNRDIQIGLLELLGNAPSYSEDARKLAEEALLSSADDALLQIAAIECLSRLRRSVEVEQFDAFFEKAADMLCSPLSRAYFALATADASEASFDRLLDALAGASELYEIDRQSGRGKGWTVSHIANALKPWAATKKDRICEAIIQAFPAAKKFGAETSALVDALVSVLAFPHPSNNYFSKKQAKGLTSLERHALGQVVEFGSWKVGNLWSANFSMQIGSYGLPNRPADLREYLETNTNHLSRWLNF